MSTNPNNAVGTNAAYGGRTSVNAFNDGIAAYTTGIMSGWACAPDTGLTVVLGGDGNTRDVAIAEDNAGNKTTINNISGSPVSVTIAAAPGSNSRIDAIVAYVDNPPQGSSSTADNPAACGIISVAGSPASTPLAPNDSVIRTAITADGASGTTAYYVVLAYVTIAAGTTDLTSDNITAGPSAGITSNNIDFTTINTWGGCQIASTSHWLAGNSMAVNLYRIGNLVIAQGNTTVQAHNQADADPYNPNWGLFPLGYRPKYTSRLIMVGVVAQGATGAWELYNDGTKVWSTPGWTGVERFYINSCWITNDPWPYS